MRQLMLNSLPLALKILFKLDNKLNFSSFLRFSLEF